MNRSKLTIGLAVVIAIVVAMPAFGGPNVIDEAGKALGIAKKAEKRSKVAKKNARLALEKAGPGPQGPVGAIGPEGPQGPTGPEGSPGLSGLEQIREISPLASDSPASVVVDCPAGKKVISSGVDLHGGKTGAPPSVVTHIGLDRVSPTPDLSGAAVVATELDAYPGNWQVEIYAVCAQVD